MAFGHRPGRARVILFGMPCYVELSVSEQPAVVVRLTWRSGGTAVPEPEPDPVLAELEHWFLTGDCG